MEAINDLPKAMPPKINDKYFDVSTLQTYEWTGAMWVKAGEQNIADDIKPINQTSYVLYKLMTTKHPITAGNFEGYPRISEYIRILRKNYNLDIKTIPVKFTTQFGKNGEFGSYKLETPLEEAWEVYKKIISSK